MDVQSYEQLTVRGAMFEDAAPWLSEGIRVLVELLDGRPIGLQLPKAVEIGIKETEPVIKGQTAAKSNKPAVLENGVTIQVPTFLGSGDRIRVDPGELRYMARSLDNRREERPVALWLSGRTLTLASKRMTPFSRSPELTSR